MKVITCASFYGTGSSAITDMLSECKDVYSLGNYEYRFLQDPHGISDLEYNVVENNHRHNTSNAIKEYLKYIKTLNGMAYGNSYKIFGNKLNEFTKDFVASITELGVNTWWHIDRVNRGPLFIIVDRLYSIIKRIIHGEINSEVKYSLLQGREPAYYTSIDEEIFLKCVKKYTDNLFSCVNKEKKPYVLVDQLVPPSNTMRYTRYLNNIKVVVVDRDPRDIYILEKKVWKWGVIPCEDVRDYVEWFKITRKKATSIGDDPEKVLRIKFEDLIYKYDEERKKVLEFVGISLQSKFNQKSQFNPDISINNTAVYKDYPEEIENIKYIEHSLPEYLYNFS